MPEQIEILKTRYDELIEAERFLLHLQALGVDNWEGYSHPDAGEDDED